MNAFGKSVDAVLPFTVVGIGASAGGLEAVTEFLQSLPKSTGMAFVFIQHLAPEAESSLVEILNRISKVPVCSIVDGASLKPDHFYVISPNTSIELEQGAFRVPNQWNPKVDYFPAE